MLAKALVEVAARPVRELRRVRRGGPRRGGRAARAPDGCSRSSLALARRPRLRSAPRAALGIDALVRGDAKPAVQTVVETVGDPTDPVAGRARHSSLLQSKDGRTLNDAAFYLIKAGEYARAIPFARKAVRYAPRAAASTRGYATFNLGLALLKVGRCAEALPLLKRALKLEAAGAAPVHPRRGSSRRRRACKVEHPGQRSRTSSGAHAGSFSSAVSSASAKSAGSAGRRPRVRRRLDEVRVAELGVAPAGERRRAGRRTRRAGSRARRCRSPASPAPPSISSGAR